MRLHRKHLSLFILVLAGIGAGGMAVSAHQNTVQDGPLNCKISTSTQNGLLKMAGYIVSKKSSDVDYSFSVKGVGRSGGTNVQQGGTVAALAGEQTMAGLLMVGGSRADYAINMHVSSKGETASCSAQVR